MEKAIKFRILEDQLSDKEFHTLVSKLARSNGGRKFIVTALFTHFNKCDARLNEIINSVSNIIESRKDKKQQIISYECIDKLPSILIAYTASFLDFHSYLDFESTNRSIYYGCNSPFSLQSLPKKLNVKYPITQSIIKYKSVQKLPLNIKYFNALSFQNKLTWKYSNINTLSLSNENGNENDLVLFLKHNCTDFKNVQILELIGFSETASLFNQLLSKFINIKFVYLRNIIVNMNDTDTSKLFPVLQGISLGRAAVGLSALINSLSSQLESLQLCGPGVQLDINDNVRFNNLKELFCLDANINVKAILNTTKSVKRVFLFKDQETELIERMKDILITQNKLTDLYIVTVFDCIIPAMKQLELSLFDIKTTKQSRDILNIKIRSLGGFKNECVYEMSLLTLRLVNMLKAVAIQFKIKISLGTKNDTIDPDHDNIKKWIKLIDQSMIIIINRPRK